MPLLTSPPQSARGGVCFRKLDASRLNGGGPFRSPCTWGPRPFTHLPLPINCHGSAKAGHGIFTRVVVVDDILRLCCTLVLRFSTVLALVCQSNIEGIWLGCFMSTAPAASSLARCVQCPLGLGAGGISWKSFERRCAYVTLTLACLRQPRRRFAPPQPP